MYIKDVQWFELLCVNIPRVSGTEITFVDRNKDRRLHSLNGLGSTYYCSACLSVLVYAFRGFGWIVALCMA